jgi:hypothetical protein
MKSSQWRKDTTIKSINKKINKTKKKQKKTTKTYFIWYKDNCIGRSKMGKKKSKIMHKHYACGVIIVFSSNEIVN